MRLPIASPYNVAESVNWLVKSVTGPSRKNAAGMGCIPSPYVLNRDVRAKYRLSFIGDIMPAAAGSARIGAGLKDFLRDSDYLVGNFEGTIVERKKAMPLLISDLAHDKNVIGMLAGLFSPARTYLSVSNNHAGDFGGERFFESIRMLKAGGFNVFGWKERPYFDINDDARVISGTMWSNRRCDYVFKLADAGRHIRPGAFNILYPHFGYELELYPRPAIINMAKEMVRKFDAIIGHHPHCPQPAVAEPVEGAGRLIAYSLGDFSGALTTKKYQYGMALKAELGRDKDGRWLLGRVEWRLTRCMPVAGGDFVVDFTNDRP